MDRTMLFGYGASGFALYLWTHGLPRTGAADVAALVAFLALLWWLTSPRRDGAAHADGGEIARQGFAFRLGKALNRIRRGRRGL